MLLPFPLKVEEGEEVEVEVETDIEKEVFIHGALCVSYSGQCLMSSLIGGRSGNRGACAGTCRLPYKLLDQNNNKLNENALGGITDNRYNTAL